MLAPGDPQFVYRRATTAEQSRGWQWVTSGIYVLVLPALRYPTLAGVADNPAYTLGSNPGTSAPYAVLGRQHYGARAPALWVTDAYAWDGATGGTEVEEGRRGSCCHDALYQIMRSYEYDWHDELRDNFRADADRVFLDIQQADGMSRWRRYARWLAVRTYPGNMMRGQGPQ